MIKAAGPFEGFGGFLRQVLRKQYLVNTGQKFSGKRLLPIFEQQEIGIVHRSGLVDRDSKDDVTAILGVQRGIAAQLQSAGRLLKAQSGCNTQAKYFVTAWAPGAFHNLVVVGTLQAALLDEFSALSLLYGREGAIVVGEILETVRDFGLLHKLLHIPRVVDV